MRQNVYRNTWRNTWRNAWVRTWLGTWLLIVLAGCRNDVSLGGPNTLVRVDREPNGPNCPTGGVAIHTGLDNDGDTYLDDDEITSTQFVCNGTSTVQCAGGKVLNGTITVRAAGDWSQLDGVNCIDGELLIAGTTADSIPRHPDLRIITGDLVVAGNPNLTSLAGIDQLHEIGGSYLIQGNDALNDIGALGGLARANSIEIVGNDALRDLAGLSSFIDIDTSITISNNAGLTSLAGLDNLRTTTRTFAIRTNRALTSLAALGNLRQVELLEISGNEVLPEVALGSLAKVDVRLLITTNSALSSVSLPALSAIGDFVRFDGDPVLARIDMPALLTTGGLLATNDNSLTTINAPNLVFATTSVQLGNLPRLATVRFDTLTSIGDGLSFTNVPVLSSLSGFARVQSVGGALSLEGAGSLRDFTGMGALEIVSGSMTVTNNAQLRSFTGLDRMKEVGGDLTITSNPLLPKTTSQAFAQRITVRGTVTIN
jgi:hypothetical protein